MTQGICRNTTCPNGASGLPVERYPGPGEYCPECGDLLEAFAAPASPEQPAATASPVVMPPPVAAPPPAALAQHFAAPAPALHGDVAAPRTGVPFGGLSPLQALQQFEAEHAAAAAPPPAPRRNFKRFAVASATLGAAGVAAVVLFGHGAMGHTSNPGDVRVCRSSMTDRVATRVIAAYAEKTGVPASRFASARSGSCDILFAVTDDPASAAVVGRDGIVAVVNPANPLVRLGREQLRRIFTGEITDWSQVGGAAGPIAAIMPDAQTDEARAIGKTLLRDATTGAGVRRVASSSDVVHAVVSGSGRGAIGIVAFSASSPAKVVRLAGAPAPSALSIGDTRYPLSVGVAVEMSAAAQPAAAGLLRFARSDDAQTLVSHEGLVPKKGF